MLDVMEAVLELSSLCISIRSSLAGYPKQLGGRGVRNSVRTPSMLVVDPSMTLCTPVLGATAGLSCRKNMSSVLKT